jgi:hypothetical protein
MRSGPYLYIEACIADCLAFLEGHRMLSIFCTHPEKNCPSFQNAICVGVRVITSGLVCCLEERNVKPVSDFQSISIASLGALNP